MSYIQNNNATFSDASRLALLSDCGQHSILLEVVEGDWEKALPEDHLSITAIRKHYGGGLSWQAVEQALQLMGVEIKTTMFLSPKEPHAYDAFWQVLTGPLADNAEVHAYGDRYSIITSLDAEVDLYDPEQADQHIHFTGINPFRVRHANKHEAREALARFFMQVTEKECQPYSFMYTGSKYGPRLATLNPALVYRQHAIDIVASCRW